jgi:hypothetical protein
VGASRLRVKKLKEKDHFGAVGIDLIILLKWI